MKDLKVVPFKAIADAIAFCKVEEITAPSGNAEFELQSKGYLTGKGYHVVYDPQELIAKSKNLQP